MKTRVSTPPSVSGPASPRKVLAGSHLELEELVFSHVHDVTNLLEKRDEADDDGDDEDDVR